LKGSETRLDIDPDQSPDIVASMTAMGEIGPFDAIYCSHALEHLAPHEVALAVDEFARVLRPGGFAVVFVPDLEDVSPSHTVLFEAPAGPITGHDLYYGHGSSLPTRPHMAHRSGFTADTLAKAFAGFSRVTVKRMGCFNLMAVAIK
jgi:ubiquinone/menaquinone biosynthesis C-methylase UbiE